ncbi:MAG: hypothetical protein GY953_30735 [bacterium]|nr:hypothetical protein [bacterium]
MLGRCGLATLAVLTAGAALAAAPYNGRPSRESFNIWKLDRGAVQTFRQAWETAGLGNRDLEALVLVMEDPTGGHEASYRGASRLYRAARFTWDPRTVAIFHTHPNRSTEKPSTRDRALADRMRVPIFTLTNRGLWGYDPATRKTSLVMDGIRWLYPKNWEKARLVERN